MVLDITKCKGGKCPLKSECLRHNSVASTYQSWFMEEPYDEEKKECGFFMLDPQKQKWTMPPNCS